MSARKAQRQPKAPDSVFERLDRIRAKVAAAEAETLALRDLVQAPVKTGQWDPARDLLLHLEEAVDALNVAVDYLNRPPAEAVRAYKDQYEETRR